MKVGDLVEFIPPPSPRRKWVSQARFRNHTAPGILIKEVANKGTASRMFTVRWHSGITTDEWVAFLMLYDDKK